MRLPLAVVSLLVALAGPAAAAPEGILKGFSYSAPYEDLKLKGR